MNVIFLRRNEKALLGLWMQELHKRYRINK